MVKYAIEFTDEFQVEIDVPPGAPAVVRFEMSFMVETEDELRRAVKDLGIDPGDIDVTQTVLSRHSVPVTRDGERVARASGSLWLGEGLVGEAMFKPPVPALARLREAELAERKRAAAEVAAQNAAAWAQSVGRPVEAIGDRVVDRGRDQ